MLAAQPTGNYHDRGVGERYAPAMGLKEELDSRFSSSDWARDVERLFAGDWQQRFAREDLHTVLGQLFGITFKAIGALATRFSRLPNT